MIFVFPGASPSAAFSCLSKRLGDIHNSKCVLRQRLRVWHVLSGYPVVMKPERIVSLVPSLTEALFAFGVGERVVGRTRYCTQPPRAVGRVAKVGGTKKIDVRRVLELAPDLIVAVKEENSRECVETLAEAGIPVFLGAPETV